MNGNSKQEKVASFIKTRVYEAVKDLAFYDANIAAVLRANINNLANEVASRATSTYDFMELSDIMAWKKPKQAK